MSFVFAYAMEIKAKKNPSISIITITSLMRLWCVFVSVGRVDRVSSMVWKKLLIARTFRVLSMCKWRKIYILLRNNNPINLNAPLIKFKACVRRSRCLKFSIFISRTKHFHSFAGAFPASFCRLYEARDRCLSRSFALFLLKFVCHSNLQFWKKAKISANNTSLQMSRKKKFTQMEDIHFHGFLEPLNSNLG